MTAQPSLWTWTDAWAVGDRVTSRYTGNRGEITAVVPARHLLIRWDGCERWPEGYTVRHSSPQGLEVLT